MDIIYLVLDFRLWLNKVKNKLACIVSLNVALTFQIYIIHKLAKVKGAPRGFGVVGLQGGRKEGGVWLGKGLVFRHGVDPLSNIPRPNANA